MSLGPARRRAGAGPGEAPSSPGGSRGGGGAMAAAAALWEAKRALRAELRRRLRALSEVEKRRQSRLLGRQVGGAAGASPGRAACLGLARLQPRRAGPGPATAALCHPAWGGRGPVSPGAGGRESSAQPGLGGSTSRPRLQHCPGGPAGTHVQGDISGRGVGSGAQPVGQPSYRMVQMTSMHTKPHAFVLSLSLQEKLDTSSPLFFP